MSEALKKLWIVEVNVVQKGTETQPEGLLGTEYSGSGCDPVATRSKPKAEKECADIVKRLEKEWGSRDDVYIKGEVVRCDGWNGTIILRGKEREIDDGRFYGEW